MWLNGVAVGSWALAVGDDSGNGDAPLHPLHVKAVIRPGGPALQITYSVVVAVTYPCDPPVLRSLGEGGRHPACRVVAIGGDGAKCLFRWSGFRDCGMPPKTSEAHGA